MRNKEKVLSTTIRNSKFGFLEQGRYATSEIYAKVKNHFPNLCDDQYLCSSNCKNGHNHPEWYHVVRNCMKNGKNEGVLVNEKRTIWEKK